MKSVIQPFLVIMCIGLLPGIPFSIMWYIAKKRGWNPVRMLAIGITLILMVISVLFWISIEEDWVLAFGVLLSLINGIAILSLPLLSPRIANLLMERRDPKEKS